MTTYLVMAPTYFLCSLYTLGWFIRRREEHCSWHASGPAVQCIFSRRASYYTRHDLKRWHSHSRIDLCIGTCTILSNLSSDSSACVSKDRIEVTKQWTAQPTSTRTYKTSTSTSTASIGTSTLHTCTSALHGHMQGKLGLSRKSSWQYLLFSYRQWCLRDLAMPRCVVRAWTWTCDAWFTP